MNWITELANEADVFFGQLSSKPVVLFGAGGKGHDTLEYLRSVGINPVCFCDNNAKLIGTKFHGLDVISYDKMRNAYKSYIVLLTVTADKAVKISERLKVTGEKNAVRHCCIPFKTCNVFTSREELRKNATAFLNLHDSLADDMSKDLFIKCVRYKVTGDALPMLHMIDDDTFFDKTILPAHDKHAYVDVGAYTGDTLIRFYAFCGGKYKKITAMEPDGENFSKMQAMVKACRLDNIELHNVGAWNKKDILVFNTIPNIDFENGNFFSANLTEEGIDMRYKERMEALSVEPASVSVPVEPLDTVLNGAEASIIKINALAADMQVLQGTEETIKKHKPALINDYGARPDYLLNVPKFITGFDALKYKLYLRQKNIFGDSKTVLFAV
jgi:FkbM family methyltransferase